MPRLFSSSKALYFHLEMENPIAIMLAGETGENRSAVCSRATSPLDSWMEF